MAKKEAFEKTEKFWGYLKIVYALCAQHNIFIKSWKKTSEGLAYMGKNEICIPPPFDDFNMMICFHEIGHILTTKGTMRDIRSEYHACRFSEDKCIEYGVPLPPEHIKDNKNYVLSYICKGIQKGNASIQSLDPMIAAYCEIDKSEWTIKVNSGLTPYMNVKGPRWQNCDKISLFLFALYPSKIYLYRTLK
jgi:hypothetical protein